MGNATLSFLLLTAATLAAQPNAGTLRGVLTDSSGAVIPAAAISLGGPDVRKSLATQPDGSYVFTGLAPGQYTIKAAFRGFETFSGTVDIKAGKTLQLTIQLGLKANRQELIVNGEPDPGLSLDADRSAAALVMKNETLDALPDDPDDLSDVLKALAGPASGPLGGPDFVVDGFSGGQLPPKASIKEIRINQNPFSSANDNLGFGRIEVVTKPGAGSLRGSAGLTDSDAYFNSRNPFATNKADYLNRMATANLAGPLGQRISFALNFNQSTIDNTALIDAVTLDASTLTPLAVRSTVVTPRDDIGGSARVDARLSTNHTLTARYQYYDSNRENNGIGQYNLSSRAYSSENARHDLQLSESAVLNNSAVSETFFGFMRNDAHQYGNGSVPSINVAGSFGAGGAQVGNASNLTQQFEIHNNTTAIHGAHTLRFGGRARYNKIADVSPANFGGTFTFFGVTDAPVLDADNRIETDATGQPITAQISSLEQYRRTLLFQSLGYSPALIRSVGGGASQFSLAGGNPLAAVSQSDCALYGQDEWRIKPNFTLTVGLRYENQTNIHDPRNFAPRMAMAWSPRAAKGSTPKTVIRAGSGFFYRRVDANYALQQLRFNGVNQRQYLIADPDFFPNIPSGAALAAQQQPVNTYQIDGHMKPLTLLATALTVERQLPRKTTLSANYVNVRATHMLTTVNINSPLPGTYAAGNPLSGMRPYGNAAGNLFQFESGGFLHQNVFWIQGSTRVHPRITLNYNYQLISLIGDADFQGFPSNPYNFRQDIGRSVFDRRNNVQIFGTIAAPWKIQFSPLFVASSGAPYDLTTGTDLNGDTVANDRPAFATDLSRPSVVITRFGAFDTNPIPGQMLVPRNYLTGAGMWNLNARIGRTFTFGKPKAAANGSQGSLERRYSVNFNLDVNNVFNHLNPGGYVGNLSSPLFGQATSINLFRDTSNNRKVQFGTQFSF